MTINDRQLRSLALAMRVKTPYPFKFRALRYLEEFHDANPEPNEAEVALLRKVGHIREDHIDHWCKLPRKSGSGALLMLMRLQSQPREIGSSL